MFQKHVDVFGRGDAAEQDDLAIERQRSYEPFHVAFEGNTITRIEFINVHAGEFLQVRESDRRRGRNQTAGGRDDENRRALATRWGEGVGISELAAEVETAEKYEHLAEAGRRVTAQAQSEIKLRSLTHDHARALAAGIGGREEEDAIHWCKEAIVIWRRIKS